MVQQVHKRANQNNMIETPRKRVRRDGTHSTLVYTHMAGPFVTRLQLEAAGSRSLYADFSSKARSSSHNEAAGKQVAVGAEGTDPTPKFETQEDNDAAAALGLLANIAQADIGARSSPKLPVGGIGSVGIGGIGGIDGVGGMGNSGVRSGIGGGSGGRPAPVSLSGRQQSPVQYGQMGQPQPQPAAQLAHSQQSAFWASQGMPHMMQQMQAQLAAQQQNLQRVAGLASQMTAFSTGGGGGGVGVGVGVGIGIGGGGVAGYVNLASAPQLHQSMQRRDQPAYDYSKEQHNAV